LQLPEGFNPDLSGKGSSEMLKNYKEGSSPAKSIQGVLIELFGIGIVITGGSGINGGSSLLRNKREISELEREIDQLATPLENEIEMKKSFEHLKKQLAAYVSFEEIDREVLNRFVSKIVVHEDETIEITYKFRI